MLCPRALLPIGYSCFNETSQACLLECSVETPVKIFSKFSNSRSFFEFLPSGLGNISDLCNVGVCPRALLPIGYIYINETSQACLLGCTVEAPVKIFLNFSNFRSFFEFLPS